MSPGSALSLIGGVLTVVGVLAAAFAVVRSSFTRTQLDILRASVADYDGRVVQLEADRARLKLANAELVAKVEVLENIVTAREAIERLLLESHNHRAEAIERHEAVMEKLDNIEDKVDEGNDS